MTAPEAAGGLPTPGAALLVRRTDLAAEPWHALVDEIGTAGVEVMPYGSNAPAHLSPGTPLEVVFHSRENRYRYTSIAIGSAPRKDGRMRLRLTPLQPSGHERRTHTRVPVTIAIECAVPVGRDGSFTIVQGSTVDLSIGGVGFEVDVSMSVGRRFAANLLLSGTDPLVVVARVTGVSAGADWGMTRIAAAFEQLSPAEEGRLRAFLDSASRVTPGVR